jgi:polyphosphate kinase
VYDEAIKKQVMHILHLQLQDNGQARKIDQEMNNVPVPKEDTVLCSQEAIYHLLAEGRV